MKPTTAKKTSLTIAVALLGAITLTHAASVGHYGPSLFNIRDFFVPDPGFYAGVYNYYYTSDRLTDQNGNQVNSVTIKPGAGPGVTLDLSAKLNSYALVPLGMWVSPWDIDGIKYGAYVAPSFANSSNEGSLSTIIGRGINPSTSQFDLGDLYVQPLWLGKTFSNLDFAMSYGFYAPVGRYSVETVTLPVVGSVSATSPKNTGLGFWTHQVQGAAAWYPWADKRMAIMSALTYEVNTKKDDIDDTPGQDLTLNWGLSQYLPLTKSHHLLLEIGPAGYDSWQISDDKGSSARNPTLHTQVHGVGGQLGLTYVPWNFALNFKGFQEFYAENRLQGQAFTVSASLKF